LYRSEAHCTVACELYGAGRSADAVLHSVRPITDTFPWLETELRSHPEQLRNLMVAVSALSGALRHAVRPRVARRHLKAVSTARAAAIDVVVGRPSSSAAFRASVGIALLDTACIHYAKGVPEGNLNSYQGSYALVRAALELLEAAGAGRSLDPLIDPLRDALPTLDPPERLLRPEDLTTLVDDLAAMVERNIGGVRPKRSAVDDLRRVAALLEDVVRSYEEGQPALAGRLAASLYVRSYDPLREELQQRDRHAEARLAETLGVHLRRTINSGVPSGEVAELGRRALSLIGGLIEGAPSSRDNASSRTHP
jgi:hypothetical protein